MNGSPREGALGEGKAFTRLRDRLSVERPELPWVKVEKEYVFDGPRGRETLADLLDGHSQLIVKHFRFGPGWSEGCVGCSFKTGPRGRLSDWMRHHDCYGAAGAVAPIERMK
jgi:predicted dithiol-disulfide oxidoreductase (DUF899 family)